MQKIFHIQFAKRRTTITMDNILSDLLAINLGLEPNAKEAHSKVREWLEQEIIDKLGDNLPTGSRISQWARVFAIEAIAKKKLMAKLIDHRLAQNG